MKAADTLRGRVEQLLAARLLGTTDRDLALWVSSIDADLREKLERVDLLERTTPTEVTKLGAFVLAYIEGRADLKPSTRMIRHQVRELLSSYFGVDRDVTTITPGDADDWQQWLIKRGMAPSTIAKRVQVARSYFRAMVRRELISRNPFDGVRATAAANADRMYFVSREETTAILDKCPDRNWRLIIALARYGGLRTPSETLSLRWQDVDWENHRIVVTSPKTAHHEGGHCRVIPLFAELRPFLDESFQLAEEGDVYCVNAKYRNAAMGPGGWANANLRTQLHKIIQRAGLTPWPKAFQNLRSTRETELAETFPIHVVTKWLGNSPKIAIKHYLQVTDDHFAKALEAAQNPAQLSAKTVQKAAQQGAASSTQGLATDPGKSDKNNVFPGISGVCQVAETGLEPVTTGL